MANLGFYLTGIRFTGVDRKPTEVRFKKGLNVLSGASDTGKSFITESVNFLLGGSEELRDLPENQGYTQFFLGISTYAGDDYVLERNKDGGDLNLYLSSLDDQQDASIEKILDSTHKEGDPDTLSVFLLSLANLNDRRIRKNKQDETVSVSFRHIAPLVVVDENRIIERRSPALSGQYTKVTEESSLLRMLITGEDNKGLIARKKPAIEKAELASQRQLLEQLIKEQKEELAEYYSASQAETSDLKQQIETLDSAIEKKTSMFSSTQQEIESYESERMKAWNSLKKAKVRSGTITGLVARFRLLEQKYISDIERLDSLAETGSYFRQIDIKICPLCGAPPSSHSHEGVLANDEVVNLEDSCRHELNKIEKLKLELSHSINQLLREQEGLEEEITASNSSYKKATEIIKKKLTVERDTTQTELESLFNARKNLERAGSLELYIEKLKNRLDELNKIKPSTKTAKPVPNLQTGQAEKFSQIAETILREWNYPALDRVTFSESKQDLVISGRDRASYGKGHRAISFAAFSISLLNYCREMQMPHPGFVFLDSPLVTYRKPDIPQEDAISEDMADAFYRYLANTARKDEQIIIIENDSPPADLLDKMTHERFTKSDIGRYGLFPTVS